MPLSDVILNFATAVYEVQRQDQGFYTLGRYTPGATTILNIAASIQPIEGRDLQLLLGNQGGEGVQWADEIQVAYTVVPLLTRTPIQEPDVIIIDSGDGAGEEPWEVIRSERWQAFGGNISGNHYRSTVARRRVP